MASIKSISLPHGTIPTQMFGNVNLQNAMMYVNENFAAVKEGVNDAVAAVNDALDAKAESDHDHDDTYAALSHTHAQSEIVGLSSALDGKAELNHEHTQYLTSLPAHYHATSDVQGLDERLQAKAEAAHTHAIADVDNLSAELGVLASTSYVDQQVNSVSTSIRVIAKDEVEDHAADKGDSSTEGTIPQDIARKPEDETTAQKNARVGTSTEYARADHVHVFSSVMDASLVDDEIYPSDAKEPYPEDLGFTEWEAGNEDGNGLKLSAYVLLSEYDGPRLMMPIVISITKDGLVSSVKKSTDDKCLVVSF